MQEYQAQVTQVVEDFVNQTPADLKLYDGEARAVQELPQQGVADLPSKLQERLELLAVARQKFRLQLIAINAYISLHTPEIKDEDNLGVHVQEAVRTIARDFLFKKESEDVECNHIWYLAERQKLISDKKDSKDKDKEGEAKEKDVKDPEWEAHSKLLKTQQLAELNRQSYRTLEQSWRNLSFQRAHIYRALTLNRAKIDKPRGQGYGSNLV